MQKLPLIFGILNTTPDSFYDGGSYTLLQAALKRADDIIKQGAQIVDIGGESTRPGASKVSAQEEITRTIPLIKEIKKLYPAALISIDTYNFETAKAALSAGACIINDISGLKNIRLAELAAEYKAKLVIMHMRGTPEDMQTLCGYNDILKEITEFFEERILAAVAAGLSGENIILDPGLGFAKTREQNWFILENLNYFKSLNMPMLIGASRKSFTDKTLEKSLLAAQYAAVSQAKYLRVHDVKETINFLEAI